eukprot:gene9286-10266_t
MPRGRAKSHKGKTRHFTSADELERQAKEVKNWREEGKSGAVSGLIDIENPNRVVQKSHKVDALDIDTPKPELTRREREAIEKEQARLRYQKLQAEGKTDEARADLARLAIVKKQREEAAKKKEEEKKAKEKEQAEAAQAARTAQESRAVAGSQKAARKKRK